MSTLDTKLRKKLEDVVVEARDIAEAGARDALQALTVHEGKRGGHLTEAQAELRNRLRIHGRQLGDVRRDNGEQAIDLLINECAYEHWHRMLFSRFLAANELLVEPKSGMAVSLEDVAEFASEENVDQWELAASFATGMLPQIFRVDSPVLALSLPTEQRKKLEALLESLPNDVFIASDSLGWVYQFWQTKRKKEVNESEVKIGARELPAVTQLFTEPYMVSFLLDNSLGAWWASRRLTEEDLRTATSEKELREKAALPGVPLEYLRFVRTPSGNEVESDENTGHWTPAPGTFDAWPKSLADLKTLDPCCGSGHFLVAAFLMLVPMRMELEGLSAQEAVNRVLSENLHGLEIDQRCVELAAFALALAAWRFPDAGGYRTLPVLNVACCGLSVSVPKEEWRALAGEDNQLKIALDWMYDDFQDAPVLGSLFDPARSMAAKIVSWEKLSPLIEQALQNENLNETREIAVVAHGLAKAATLLGRQYQLAITNVPYLSRGKHEKKLFDFCDVHHQSARGDLATVFLDRCMSLLVDGGTSAIVLPQNWLFLSSYKRFREKLLKRDTWNLVARLGPKGFSTPMWDFNVQLITLSRGCASAETFDQELDSFPENTFFGTDVSELNSSQAKLEVLKSARLVPISQQKQLQTPDSRITFVEQVDGTKINELADCNQGLVTGDIERFTKKLWEVPCNQAAWVPFRRSCGEATKYGDVSDALFWEEGTGQLHEYARETRDKLHDMHESGNRAWNKRGVAINRLANLRAVPYYGEHFDNNVAVVYPETDAQVATLLSFFQSDCFPDAVRAIDQKLNVTNATLIKVSFDLHHWQAVAAEKFPYGLPEPYSDDPTQWVFHGHPASSDDALQVSVARLLGYRWPAELNAAVELATDARAWIDRGKELSSFLDDDGIVCIPAVATEQPADGRLLSLLHQAFEDGRAQERVFSEKIESADENDPLTLDLLRRGWKPALPNDFNLWFNRLLDADGHKGKSLESWLRDKFFDSHCKRFNHTPFIWQIWDGHREGFSALVNYHKLAGLNGRRLLEKLTHSYLGDWINRQQDEVKRDVEGADGRLIAARNLKAQLELILAGAPPYDIFVRWKPLAEQPIGWEPDINDGVRLNIRPFMAVDIPGGKKGAGILRVKPNTIKWTKDRGKEVERPMEDFPWFWDWDGKTQNFTGGKNFTGDRWNDLHYTNAFKQKAREAAKNREESVNG
jgi:hypothetical protein